MKTLVVSLCGLVCAVAAAQQFPKAGFEQPPFGSQPKPKQAPQAPFGSFQKPMQAPNANGGIADPLEAHASAIKMLSRRIDALEDRIKQLEAQKK